MRFYSLDLRIEFGRMPLRRLWVLLQGLPENAAVWRQDSWTQQEEFLAELIELTDISRHTMVAVLGGEAKKLGDPIRIKRPWDDVEEAEPEKPQIETDTRKIAHWFAMNS